MSSTNLAYKYQLTEPGNASAAVARRSGVELAQKLLTVGQLSRSCFSIKPTVKLRVDAFGLLDCSTLVSLRAASDRRSWPVTS